MWVHSNWIEDGYTSGFYLFRQNVVVGCCERTVRLNRGTIYLESVERWQPISLLAHQGFSRRPASETERRGILHSGGPVTVNYQLIWPWHGVAIQSSTINWNAVGYHMKSKGAAVPLWLLVTTFSILPSVFLASGIRRKRQPGFCRKCGYDLRATPDRCPECGTLVDEDEPLR
jgi:hypothetical protein